MHTGYFASSSHEWARRVFRSNLHGVFFSSLLAAVAFKKGKMVNWSLAGG